MVWLTRLCARMSAAAGGAPNLGVAAGRPLQRPAWSGPERELDHRLAALRRADSQHDPSPHHGASRRTNVSLRLPRPSASVGSGVDARGACGTNWRGFPLGNHDDPGGATSQSDVADELERLRLENAILHKSLAILRQVGPAQPASNVDEAPCSSRSISASSAPEVRPQVGESAREIAGLRAELARLRSESGCERDELRLVVQGRDEAVALKTQSNEEVTELSVRVEAATMREECSEAVGVSTQESAEGEAAQLAEAALASQAAQEALEAVEGIEAAEATLAQAAISEVRHLEANLAAARSEEVNWACRARHAEVEAQAEAQVDAQAAALLEGQMARLQGELDSARMEAAELEPVREHLLLEKRSACAAGAESAHLAEEMSRARSAESAEAATAKQQATEHEQLRKRLQAQEAAAVQQAGVSRGELAGLQAQLVGARGQEAAARRQGAEASAEASAASAAARCKSEGLRRELEEAQSQGEAVARRLAGAEKADAAGQRRAEEAQVAHRTLEGAAHNVKIMVIAPKVSVNADGASLEFRPSFPRTAISDAVQNEVLPRFCRVLVMDGSVTNESVQREVYELVQQLGQTLQVRVRDLIGGAD